MDGAGDVEGRAPGVAAERWITSQAGTTVASQISSAKPSSYSGEATGSPSLSPSSSSWANKIPQPLSSPLSPNPPSSFNASREGPSIARNTFSAPRVVSSSEQFILHLEPWSFWVCIVEATYGIMTRTVPAKRSATILS